MEAAQSAAGHTTSPSTARHAPPAYRPDIDGLRAIAVASVVLFHAGVAGFPGGFVGVDVFFVISGYLIGGQLFKEFAARSFSFSGFYTRRVRRILPALFFTVLTTYVVGWLVMTPFELRDLGKEAVASLVGASNILFYMGSDYFSPAADRQPLLMTWSLGVEEQFYVVFPFVVLLLVKLPRRYWLAAILGLSLVSFAGSLILLPVDQRAAFYLLPTRAWELGVGTALALWQNDPRSRPLSPRLAQAVAACGLALLVAGIVLYRPTWAFPGVFALLPTIGTVLLIAAGSSLINRRLLSVRPMVFLGKVSYSWYLWHWPLFVFYRLLGDGGHLSNAYGLLIASLVLGVLSWRFIEQPFRRRVLGQGQVLPRYAAVGAVLVAFGLGLYLVKGAPQRLGPEAQAFARQASQAQADPCLAPFGVTTPNMSATCVSPVMTGQDRLLVLGDSHAASLSAGLRDAAERSGMGWAVLTKSSCPPLSNHTLASADRPRHGAECMSFLNAAFDYVRSNPDIRVVALAGYWNSMVNLRPGEAPSSDQIVPLFQALDETVKHLHAEGRRVVLVQDAPAFAFDPYERTLVDLMPARQAVSSLISDQSRAGGGMSSLNIAQDESAPVLEAVRRVNPGVEIWDPRSNLCSEQGCRFRSQTSLFYSDFQHLTADGAREAARTWVVR